MRPEIGVCSLSFVVLLVVLISSVGTTTAQTEHTQQEDITSDIPEANQKSISVVLGTGDDDLNMLVSHVVHPSDEPTALGLIDVGVLKDGVLATNNNTAGRQLVPDAGIVIIPPSDEDTKIEYELEGAIRMVDGFYTLEFLYRQTTVFYPPDDAELIFIGNRVLDLGNKSGFACHGCQMVLEYATDIPTKTEFFQTHDEMTIPVEVTTHAKTDSFAFDEITGELSFQISGERQFVVVTIPKTMMTEPYTVSLDGNRIFFQKHSNNEEAEVWFNMRPETGGIITIDGTTSSIAPPPGDQPSDPDPITVEMMIGVAAAVAGISLLLIMRRVRR